MRVREAVVVGGGPGGAVAALTLARAGCDVVLAERASFPRFKVCGGCLTGAAMAALADLDLATLPAAVGGRSFARLRLVRGGTRAEVAVRPGVAVAREQLDAALVEEARRAGADVRLGTEARVGPADDGGRTVRLRDAGGEEEVRARMVVMATGLSGPGFPAGEGFEDERRPGSRLGVGAVVAGLGAEVPDGTIVMAVERGGYVGLVRVGGGRLAVAGAFDPAAVQGAGGPGPAVARLLRRAGGPAVPGLEEAKWRGTPFLTARRRRVAGRRLVVLGDAAGFIEPFTGEGMAWAMAAALAAAPLVEEGVRTWDDRLAARWQVTWTRLVGRRQLRCRLLALSLRRPVAVAAAVRLLRVAPRLAAPLTAAVGSPLARAVRE